MGHTINANIAKITKPKQLSLSETANYIQFESTNNSAPKQVKIVMSVSEDPFTIPDNLNEREQEEYIIKHSSISFTEQVSKNKYTIEGTKDVDKIKNNTYLISDLGASVTASNIKECLMKNTYLANNFRIDISFSRNEKGEVSLNNSIQLTSLGGGEKYMLHFDKEQNANNKVVQVSPLSPSSTNQDSIDNGSGKASIELEVYTHTGSQLGENKFPENSMGTYMTTLRKSYHGTPLWFDLNALMANRSSYKDDFLTANGWCDAGTVTDYRLVARRYKEGNREPFYLSDVLYCITGYNRNLETTNMEQYVYNAQHKNIVKPLTKQPTLPHVQGQTQYFNFILADSNRQTNHQIGITYRIYTQTKKFIAEYKTSPQGKKMFVVNSLKLDMDHYIEQHPKAGYIEVYLTIAGISKSEPLSFKIQPSYLHKVNDFAFLNSLGGWNSFNFGGDTKNDFRSSSDTIFKTQTPDYNLSSQLEAVNNKDIKEHFTVKTTPIDRITLEWLKEMSASIAVYELSSKRYIIVDELQIRPSSKDELFEVEMKYKYTDSFNGSVK